MTSIRVRLPVQITEIQAQDITSDVEYTYALSGGDTTITVAAAACVRFTEHGPGGDIRYCVVSGGSANYEDLVDIDPSTFLAADDALPAWAAVAAAAAASAVTAGSAATTAATAAAALAVDALDIGGATVIGRAGLRATDAAEYRDIIGASSAVGASKELAAGANIVFTDATSLTVSAQVGEQGLFSSMPRYAVRDASVASATSTLRLSYARATRSAAYTLIRARTGTTAAAATPTLCKMGIFSVAANGDLTRLARTANDTSLFSTISTAYEVVLDATVNTVAGQLYAFALLVVTSAAAPTFQGMVMLNATDAGLGDRYCGSVPGQTDIISSIGFASVADSTSNPCLALR